MPLFNNLTHSALDIASDTTDIILDTLNLKGPGSSYLSNAIFKDLSGLSYAEYAFGTALANHHTNFITLEGLAVNVSVASNALSSTLDAFHVPSYSDLARDANDLTADLTVYTQGLAASSLFQFV